MSQKCANMCSSNLRNGFRRVSVELRPTTGRVPIPSVPIILFTIISDNPVISDNTIISNDHSCDQQRDECQSRQNALMAPLQSVSQGEWSASNIQIQSQIQIQSRIQTQIQSQIQTQIQSQIQAQIQRKRQSVLMAPWQGEWTAQFSSCKSNFAKLVYT